MTTHSPKNTEEIISICQSNWQKTHDNCSNSTENALLVTLYGALLHVAESGTLDSDRHIIQASTLEKLLREPSIISLKTFNAETITQKLNAFIHTQGRFIWDELPTFDSYQKHELARELIPNLATELFDTPNEVAASRILLFLFPMLPAFHYRPSMSFTADVEIESYKEFHRLAAKHYRLIKPALDKIPKPEALYGDAQQQVWIKDMLAETDWWQRRIFNETLKDMAQHSAA